MKKLFFTALVAVAAVGGAIAQSGSFYSQGNSGQPDIICDGGETLCSSIYAGPAYENPAPDQTVPVTLSSYRYTDGVL